MAIKLANVEIPSTSSVQTALDAKLDKSGGTITGNLTVNGDLIASPESNLSVMNGDTCESFNPITSASSSNSISSGAYMVFNSSNGYRMFSVECIGCSGSGGYSDKHFGFHDPSGFVIADETTKRCMASTTTSGITNGYAVFDCVAGCCYVRVTIAKPSVAGSERIITYFITTSA